MRESEREILGSILLTVNRLIDSKKKTSTVLVKKWEEASLSPTIYIYIIKKEYSKNKMEGKEINSH